MSFTRPVRVWSIYQVARDMHASPAQLATNKKKKKKREEEKKGNGEIQDFLFATYNLQPATCNLHPASCIQPTTAHSLQLSQLTNWGPVLT